jgi:hypothetical protein
MREIVGLVWAKPCQRPKGIPRSRPRGTKALGLSYERRVAKALPGAISGQWFEYFDANGPGYCQMDLVLKDRGQVWVVEVKLTDIFQGKNQLNKLYLPIARAIWGSARGAVVVRHLSKALASDLIFENFDQAQGFAAIPVIHWLGSSPLWPSRSAKRTENPVLGLDSAGL